MIRISTLLPICRFHFRVLGVHFGATVYGAGTPLDEKCCVAMCKERLTTLYRCYIPIAPTQALLTDAAQRKK